MLRPYLAVIKDSYRAAASNWALYAMLGLVTLILIALFPFWVEEQLTTEIRREGDIRNVNSVSRRLIAASQRAEPSPAKRVWDFLPEETQTKMKDMYGLSTEPSANPKNSESPMERAQKQEGLFNSIVSGLNDLLDDPTLYDEASWKNVALTKEARELIEEGPENLSGERLARLNRLLINATFPGDLEPGPQTSIRIKYAWWNFTNTALPIRRSEIPVYLNIPFFLDKLVLSIGVLVAILVTSPVIPQMLEPGSLNLLLSKPISRWKLFLAKYFGACAFIVLVATYLFVGLWLFFGLRLGFWDTTILASIPLYLLVFAIYFSVSVLAGAVFRSTIIAVVAAILFWVLCFVVGTVYSMSSSIHDSYEIKKMVAMDDGLLQVDSKNVPFIWDRDEGTWKQAFIPEGNKEIAGMVHVLQMFTGNSNEIALMEILGPVYDPDNQRLIAAQFPMSDFGSPFQVSDPLVGYATQEADWEFKALFPSPGFSVAIFRELDGEIILATRLGSIHRMTSEAMAKMNADGETSENESPAAEEDADAATASENQAEAIDPAEVFEVIGPDIPFDFSSPAAIAQCPTTGELVVYSQGTVDVLTRNSEGTYERIGKNSLTLPGGGQLSVRMAFAGDWIIVGLGNGKLYQINRPSMEVLNSFDVEAEAALKDVVISPDGRWFGAVYGNGHFWLGDNQAESPEVVLADVKGQGDISAAAFTSAGDLWIADRVNRARRYSAEQFELQETLTPREGFLGLAYRYGLVPLYVICPKPGEFYRLVSHLTKDSESDETVERRDAEDRNPWEPLWNGLIFIAVMLLIGCVYIERQDF